MKKIQKKVTAGTRIKKKVKRAYRRKLMYTCTFKQEQVRNFVFDELNEHGAFNDVYKKVPIYELQFGYTAPIARNVVPEVLHTLFHYSTTNKEVYDKYQVGETYNELPK